MTADLLARLVRTALQMIGVWIMAKFNITEGNWEAISGALLTIITTGFTVYASRKATGDTSKIQSPAIVGIAAITLAVFLGGCQATIKDFAAKSPAEKAQASLEFTCAAYPAIDAAFNTVYAATPDKIPARVVQAEAAAVAALQAICAKPPTDPVSALTAAASAYSAAAKALAEAKQSAP